MGGFGSLLFRLFDVPGRAGIRTIENERRAKPTGKSPSSVLIEGLCDVKSHILHDGMLYAYETSRMHSAPPKNGRLK